MVRGSYRDVIDMGEVRSGLNEARHASRRGRERVSLPTGRRRCATKLIQAEPSKSKQKRLDLLGFIRPNRDFSMGYSDSK